MEHHEDKLQQELDEFNREREPNVLLYNSYLKWFEEGKKMSKYIIQEKDTQREFNTYN